MTAPTILILGANSDIARAIARAYAAQGCNLILAARRAERLDADTSDLLHRGAASARRVECDLLDTQRISVFLDHIGPLPDTILCAAGLLGDQAEAQTDPALADTIMRTNYLAPALLLGEAANRMEKRGTGMIIGIASVAGERGRASNYIYGSAKAGFIAFLSGLRNRLASRGVHVMTVQPGFVATRMTSGMNLPKPLTAQPAEVAAIILKAARSRKNTVYAYPVWRWIMLLIRQIPEPLFKRLKL